MWHELEDEHLLNWVCERMRVRLRHQRNSNSHTNVSSTMSDSRGSENKGSLGEQVKVKMIMVLGHIIKLDQGMHMGIIMGLAGRAIS